MRRNLILLLAAGGVALLALVLVRTFSPPPAPPPPVVPGAGEGVGTSAGPGPGEAPSVGLPAPGEGAAGETGVVLGTVREAGSGLPVEGAEVTATSGRRARKARTGAAGGYRIEGLDPGSVRVRARTRDLVDEPATFVSVEPGLEARADFDLRVGAVIRGRVLDEKTEAAIEGATVTLSGAALKKIVSGPDGGYRIRGVESGLVLLSAVAPDYPLARVQADVPDGSAEVIRDLFLVRGATVRGRVTDEEGGVLEGALVAFQSTSGKTFSGPDGAFVLRGIPVARPVWVQASREGFVPARSPALRMKSGEEYDLADLVLTRGGRVSGVVLLADGNPAEGALVRLRPLARVVSRAPTVRTGADGRFDLFPVPPGEYEAAATLSGALEARVGVPPVATGAKLEGVVLRLGAGESIQGVVRDEAGRPLDGIRVTSRPDDRATGTRWATAVTDREGRFRLVGLASGTYLISAVPPRGGGGVSREAVAAGTVDLVLSIPSGGVLSGRVVDGDGRAATSFVLRADPEDRSGGRRAIFERVTNERGEFRIEGVPAGGWTVSATAPGAFSRAAAGVTVAAGGETGGLALTLGPGGTVRGRLLTDDGRPVEGARVNATSDGAERIRTGFRGVRTDPDGRFLLSGLRPGRYRLTAARDARTAVRDGLEVGAGAEVEVDLRLPAEGRIVVRVVAGDGSPIEGATVHLRGPGGTWVPVSLPDVPDSVPPDERGRVLTEARLRATRTGPDGVCVRERVPSGELTVKVSANGHREGEKTVAVKPGSSTEARIVLEAGESERERKERNR